MYKIWLVLCNVSECKTIAIRNRVFSGHPNTVSGSHVLHLEYKKPIIAQCAPFRPF